MTSPKLKTLGLLGCGNMGSAIARGVVDAKLFPADRVIGYDLQESALDSLKMLGCKTLNRIDAFFEEADTIILAIKPQIVRVEALEWGEVFAHLYGEKTFISIMAGIRTSWLKSIFSDPRTVIIRAMPNLGLSVGEGATAIATDGLGEESLQLAETIFKSCGLTVRVTEEQIDAVTGVSGSGPMYLFEFIQGLTQAGINVGLPPETAYQLAIQTAKGSLKLLETSPDMPSVWSARVRSPGGTTEAAQKVLERDGFHAILIRAVAAAVARSKELSA